MAIFIPAECPNQSSHDLILLQGSRAISIPIMKPLSWIPVETRDGVGLRSGFCSQHAQVTKNPIFETTTRCDKLRKSDGSIAIRVPLVPMRLDVFLQLVAIHWQHTAQSF